MFFRLLLLLLLLAYANAHHAWHLLPRAATYYTFFGLCFALVCVWLWYVFGSGM